MGTKVLIVLVYNDNGIATWCYEAARGLRLAGCQVWLAHTHLVIVPQDLQESVILFAAPKRGLWEKIQGRMSWVAPFLGIIKTGNKVIPACLAKLNDLNIKPDLILVSQCDFIQTTTVAVPQWVVARAWPITLAGYLEKMNLASSVSWLTRMHNLLFWYQMDKKAYRQATGVLAVTQKLADDLQQRGINAACVYPGSSSSAVPVFRESGTVHFITAALGLDDKRKNILWLVNLLSQLKPGNGKWSLTLVGICSQHLQQLIQSIIPRARFTGKISRERLMNEMQAADVFLFSSNQENWGYVLVEAMAQGLAVVAPNQYPFTEIIGRADYQIELDNTATSLAVLENIVANPSQLATDRQWFYDRYNQLFSTKAFGQSLLKTVKIKG